LRESSQLPYWQRTVRIDMDDTMRYSVTEVMVKEGETIRFVVRNRGRVMHAIRFDADHESSP